MSIYGFEIPHHKVKPLRDYVAIQLPMPPRRIGSIVTPDVWREVGQHSVQAGIIRAMGPLGFKYKDGEGLTKHDAKIGDWVIIRWGAGTMFQAGRGIVVTGGWRYVTSFNDIIGYILAEDMPDPKTLEWEEGDDEKLGMVQGNLPLEPETGVRERVTYRS
jgi:co-chaperonin GroES (HSP10)